MADIELLVVNRLTLQDHIYVTKLKETYGKNNSNASVKERVFLVHNLKDIETLRQLDTAIRTDIIDAFGAAPSARGYYESDNFYHFVFAREGTPAGIYVNPNSVQLLRTMIKAWSPGGLRGDQIIPRLMNHSKMSLEQKYLLDIAVEHQQQHNHPTNGRAEHPWLGWLAQKQRLLGSQGGGAEYFHHPNATINKPVVIDLEFKLLTTLNKEDLDSFGIIARKKSEGSAARFIISPFLEIGEDGSTIQNFAGHPIFRPPVG